MTSSWIVGSVQGLLFKAKNSKTKKAHIHDGNQQLCVLVKLEVRTVRIDMLGNKIEFANYKPEKNRKAVEMNNGETHYLSLTYTEQTEVKFCIMGRWDPPTGESVAVPLRY